MKQNKRILILAILCLLPAANLLAAEKVDKAVEAAQSNSRGFGIGVMAGTDFGFNGKLFFTRNLALDFTVGPGFGRGLGFGIHADTDFQYQFANLFGVPTGELDLYVGAGVGVNFGGFVLLGGPYGGLEIRVPIGVEYYLDSHKPFFEKHPMSFGVEAVPNVPIWFAWPLGRKWGLAANAAARWHF